MRASQLLAAVVALSSVSAAWSDVFDNTHALGEVKNILYGRQDSSESADPEPTTEERTTEAPKETGDASATEKPTATNADDSKTTDNESGKDSGKATKSSGKPTPTKFGPDVQAGGVAMITPNVFEGKQFYKIGDTVHLAWNYTSLKVAPSAVDVLASCTANQATYTIALNQSVEATGEVFWDTKSYKDDHPNGAELLTEMYTLIIYDSNSTVTEPAKPGYLAPYKQFEFGMYSPQPYTPWADYKCANCNGALSPFEQLTLKAIFLTSATTMASLLYFTASFGVW